MSILLELHNNHFNVIETINLSSHVTAHTEYLRYNKYTDASSTLLNYFESEIQTPAKNIKIEDLSYKHPSNNLDYLTSKIEEYEGKVFTSLYKDLVITNVIDIDGTPLFYKHKTRFKNEPQVNIVNEGEFIDGNQSFKYIDGYLYNNYENTFDYKNRAYQLIFLSGQDIDGKPITEILNNESAIEELSWRDINVDLVDGVDILSGTNGTAKVNSYVRTQIGNGYEYQVIIVDNFCDSEKENSIYVKYLESNSLKLIKPKNINQKESWFISIQNGFFFTNKKYFIPEYDYQNFNPEYGVLKNYDKECFLLNKFETGSILKVEAGGLILDKNLNLHITVKILNSSEELLKVYTSDPSLIGNEHPEKEDVFYESGIESIDSINGIIVLEKDIYGGPESFNNFEKEIKIRADFYNNVNNYKYQKLDLNPLFNEDVLHCKYFFYLRPDRDFKESIYYLKLSYRNEIEDSNDRDLHSSAGGKEHILKLSYSQFKETYLYGYQNQYQFLELGEISYKETAYIDEAVNFDIRDSTAINEQTFEEYVSRQHRVLQSDFGYGEEGQVYQENNIIHVTLPKSLDRQYGGEYTENEIFELLKLKSTSALDIIFDWEDKKPELIILPYTNDAIRFENAHSPSQNKIKLKWSFEGPGTYLLYRFESIQGFDKTNQDLIVNELIVTEREAIDYISTRQVAMNLIDESFYVNHEDNLDEYSKVYYYKVVYENIYESDTVSFKTREGAQDDN